MANLNTKEQYDIGMIGLGVMGRNMLLNMADHGFSVVGFDKDLSKVEALRQESSPQHKIQSVGEVKPFIELLRTPRAIILLVPAGPAVDAVIQELTPLLQAGDLIIDNGNSYFKDTDVRMKNLAAKGINFLGVGVSGGESGARHGPSIMPGGSKEAYERVRPIFEAIAAKADNMACVAYLGPGSAGHYVKMVHNGIEYGIMQIISESYDVMRRALGFNNDQLHEIYSAWNNAELNSYLIEITGHIFEKIDDKTDNWLIDVILGVARQLGTGMWTSQSAMELGVPTPCIDIAVTMRAMSIYREERTQANNIYHRQIKSISHNPDERDQVLVQLRHALFASMIIIYAQGMALLSVASAKYGYQLDLETVSQIWRGGCIIRSSLLNEICAAFRANRQLANLLLDPNLSQKVIATQEDLRKIIIKMTELGIPIPGLTSALNYLDDYRSDWLPANLIQAQRDYFGSHTYERIDAVGTFHTQWEERQS